MKRSLLSFALWLTLGGCAALAPAILDPPAYAQASVLSVTTYYSDSSHTTIVGSKMVYCDGTVSINGTVTHFFAFRTFNCSSPQ